LFHLIHFFNSINKFKKVQSWLQDKRKCSLWDAKIFPICKTREESFLFSLSLISVAKSPFPEKINSLTPPSSNQFEIYLSISEILTLKNTKEILCWRERLEIEILLSNFKRIGPTWNPSQNLLEEEFPTLNFLIHESLTQAKEFPEKLTKIETLLTNSSIQQEVFSIFLFPKKKKKKNQNQNKKKVFVPFLKNIWQHIFEVSRNKGFESEHNYFFKRIQEQIEKFKSNQ